MDHWSDNWLGHPYVPGEYDCAELAADVARSKFGRDVSLPSRQVNSAALSAQVSQLWEDFAALTQSPQEGDLVLMRAVSSKRWHIGILCLINGEQWILHGLKRAKQVTRHRPRDLEGLGLELEGYYTWKQ